MTTTDNGYRGKADISLSNYTLETAPAVKVGSIFDNKGTMFEVDTSDITPTGYAGIANSTTFYLYYDEAPTGAFVYLATVPTWNDSYQGWYNGNDRALFSMYKDSAGTLYQGKHQLVNLSRTSGGNFPVGFVYTQYPTKDSPIELGFHGTWTNISSDLPGSFFRAEGGDASAFESGLQQDLVKAHTHNVKIYGTGGSGGVLIGASTLQTSNGDQATDANTGAENRPINRTVRLWERTA